MFGKLAFDALKSLRYKCLTILMDGNLDGEIVTQVSFNGINQDPIGAMKNGMFSQFIGLPRSEEHTSELQSLMRLSSAVFCLTKKNTLTISYSTQTYM